MMKRSLKNVTTILLLAYSSIAYSQIVKGKVLNEDGNNLVGVVIGVEGGNIGDITDEKGSFSIDFTNFDKSKNLIAYLGGFEPFKMKISDYLNKSIQNIILTEKVINIQEVELTPQKTYEKNLGIDKKSKILYCGYNSKENKDLFKEFAVKIKNKKRIKIKNINIIVSDYNIETPILLMFDIYSNKNNLPNQSLISETLSKEITNMDVKNNVISLDVSDKNIWVEDDFFVSVRTANDFKGYLYLSGNIFAFSQDTYYRLYFDKWKKFSSGGPSINIDALIAK